ncbi:Ribosome biogenesis protein ytm1 [Cryomyces minteri]|uniref:Ribosome biogenesis protein YTM1 n=1 Tax=Cryomyces minteri TaxID=331657 RepID=A0A4U0VPS0_9PEZI|nr:Ribosome biogenesis protein ytm1 [Cryomyces minteri]
MLNSHRRIRALFLFLLVSTDDALIPREETTTKTALLLYLRRYQLSTLVNRLLDNEKPTPFEFLINGQFLRNSIDDFLTANGISAETTLTIEYVRALIPPLHLASFEHDDWISSVDVLSEGSPAGRWAGSGAVSSGHERILSGSYDGLLRVWNTSAEVLAVSSSAADGGHTSSAKAAKFLSPSQIVSSGLDRTIKIWKYTEPSDRTSSATMIPSLDLYGHKSSIDSLAVHQPTSRILSASADHTVGLWSTRKSDAPEADATLLPSSNKRRKTSGPSKSTPARGPLSLLTAHSAPVSAVIFAPADPTVAHSASWDHTLRLWDLPTATCVDVRTTAQPLLSLAALPALTLLATGTSARHITLVDPRASATTIAALTLRGHTNAVVALAPDPNSAYGLVSGSHDGTCRIWDVRSVRSAGGIGGEGQVGESVYSIERAAAKGGRRVAGEGVKVFGVVWDAAVGIVSAGEDKRVQINR